MAFTHVLCGYFEMISVISFILRYFSGKSKYSHIPEPEPEPVPCFTAEITDDLAFKCLWVT